MEAPAADVAQGRATPGFESAGDAGRTANLVRIHSSSGKPSDAFVAVPYRNSWFWIDDRDIRSKRAFAFMMILFTLSDTGEKGAVPLIPIPAQYPPPPGGRAWPRR